MYLDTSESIRIHLKSIRIHLKVSGYFFKTTVKFLKSNTMYPNTFKSIRIQTVKTVINIVVCCPNWYIYMFQTISKHETTFLQPSNTSGHSLKHVLQNSQVFFMNQLHFHIWSRRTFKCCIEFSQIPTLIYTCIHSHWSRFWFSTKSVLK